MKQSSPVFAKPSPLLESHLLAKGFHWSSVVGVSQWHELWNKGTVPDELQQDFDAFDNWLASGAQASMQFLEKNQDVRKDPRKILAGVESILSVIVPYAHGKSVRGQSSSEQAGPTAEGQGVVQKESSVRDDFVGKVARYARVPDYHKAIKAELTIAMQQWQHAALTQGIISAPVSWRVATDSLPFLDRAHARLAGLGFVGKNTMLIRPGVGSFFFIAQVLVSAPLQVLADSNLTPPVAAAAIADLDCGDCRKCIDACPTSALTATRFLDSNRCLSFLTIEHRDIFADEFIPHLGDRFYGCDICQEVCPYNLKTLPLQSIQPFARYNHYFHSITIADVARMNQSEYEKWFGGTALTRAKYAGLVRNALYSLYAQNDDALTKILTIRKDDPHPLIAASVAHILRLSRHHSVHVPQ